MTLITPINRSYRGVQPGEPMEMPEKFARILIAAKRAERMPEPKKRKKGTYERRDLQAVETTTTQPPETKSVTPVDPVDPVQPPEPAA